MGGLPRWAQLPEPVARRFGNAIDGPYRRIAPIIDMLEHDPNALSEGHLRRPAEFTVDLRDVGPGAIGFARTLVDVHGRRCAKQAHQLVDADRRSGADVVHLADAATIGDG